MNSSSQDAALLDQFRAEFDRGFACPARRETADAVGLLGFGAGDGIYAAYLHDVAAIREFRTVTRVPGRRSGFEGLAAVQGQLLAVYDLAALLAATRGTSTPRWLLLCREDLHLGFAVDRVDGYMQIPRSQIMQVVEKDQRSAAVRQVVAEGRTARLIVDLAMVISSIRSDVERERHLAR